MEKNKANIESLITGFFTGSLDEDDLGRLNRWLDEDPAHRKEFNKLRSTWIISGYDTGKKSFDARPGWSTIEQNIKPGKTGWIKRFAPIWHAASLLICFALGSVVSVAVSRQKPVQQPDLATYTTIRVPLGAKSSVTLPDSSSVWLNAGSIITYSSDFGLKNRSLQLTGEAFFDVKSDSLKPFNVHTSGMTVRALGTRFNVKAYPNDNTIAATLEDGTVDVVIPTSSGGKISEQKVKLKPKEQLVIQKTQLKDTRANDEQSVSRVQSQQGDKDHATVKEITIHPNVKTELSTSWKDEKWIIDDQYLDLFVIDLERRYNLDIMFTSDELKDYKFSGTIENQTAEQILTALSLAAPVNYIFNKNKVVLSLNEKDKDKFSKILKTKK